MAKLLKVVALTAFLAIAAEGRVLDEAQAKGAPDFDHLRRSVVRIQSVSAGFDWLHPFSPGADGVGLGSGFVVQTHPYPLFVTNEHVINDAKRVTLQLLLYGEHQWEAQVVSVCPKFDIALLVLRNVSSFNEAMASQDIKLEALPLAKGMAAMGEDVVAMGFPLGQDSLKISKGNIAGNEEVDENICIQSTAPISPGSSGGPLLDAAARKVVGVNFAKATEGENINYVIPAWRVQQLVNKHLHDQPKPPANGQEWKRLLVQAPKPELTTIESNDALYSLSACDKGLYIARVGERSFFRKATPAVEDGSFLLSVNGKQVDQFGMGLNSKFVADRVSFADLFFMVEDISKDVEFETCYEGKSHKHKVSMAWQPEYERGLRWVDEPVTQGMQNAFEMFGDICVMEMTVNHISSIISQLQDPGPARWLHPDLVAKPRLVITYVRPGSYASDILPVGAAVTKVNGFPVSTLAEWREKFIPSNNAKVWTVETDMGKVTALMFNQTLATQLQQARGAGAMYLLTPTVMGAAQKMGFLQGQEAGVGEAPATPHLRGVGPSGQSRHPQAFMEVVSEASSVKAAGPLVAAPAAHRRSGRSTSRHETKALRLKTN